MRAAGFLGLAISAVVYALYLWQAVMTQDVFIFGAVQTRDLTHIVTLVNSTDAITAGNYDTYESPQGTPYQVADTEPGFAVFLLQGTPLTSPNAAVHIHLGYGDDAVQNSATPPTNAVIVWDVSYPSADGVPAALQLWALIPAGKFPYVFASGGAYNISAVGYTPE